jgi:N-acetylglucosamine kinase
LKVTGGTVDDIAAVTAGITKFTRDGITHRWQQALREMFPNAVCDVLPDYVIAFHGAIPEGEGIAVIAGTGSVVYGTDGQGGTVRVGGRGWEYGDEGSGAHLTTDAIRCTLRALDGMEEATPLTDAICTALGTDDPANLAERARQRALTEGRGFLVPLILARAQEGDSEAANLFVGAAGWLAAGVRAAYRHLHFPEDKPVRIAGIGGLWSAEELLTLPFTRVIHRWIPHAVVQSPEAEPSWGAVWLALRAAPLTTSDSRRTLD